MSSDINSNVLVGTCPGCGAKIRFHGPVSLGEFVACEECDDELEVVKIKPLKLDWAYADPIDDDEYIEDDFYYDEDDYDWGDE